LFYALSTTLEKEFQGQDRAGSAYKIYADIATNILRSPAETIQSVRREFKADKQKENNTNKRKNQVITTDDGQETIESVDDIEGVSTEDQLDLIEKRNIADNKQQEIFDFDQ
jgi:rubrerythrin